MLGIRGEALVTCFLYNSVEILDPYGTWQIICCYGFAAHFFELCILPKKIINILKYLCASLRARAIHVYSHNGVIKFLAARQLDNHYELVLSCCLSFRINSSFLTQGGRFFVCKDSDLRSSESGWMILPGSEDTYQEFRVWMLVGNWYWKKNLPHALDVY